MSAPRNNQSNGGVVASSRSISSTSCNSFVSDAEENAIENGVEEIQINKRASSGTGSRMQKAKRVRFYHNGNKFFHGVMIPVTTDRYRTFESLKAEVTNMLNKKDVPLRSSVRTIYSMEGRKISTIDDLEDGGEYVASSGDTFKKLEYTHTDSLRPKRTSSIKPNASIPKPTCPDFIIPRIVIVIRNGLKPRKIKRILLNKRNASNMEQALRSLTDVAQLDSGAVRKVFNNSGQQVTTLEQFFRDDDVFFVYGNERFSADDFQLEFEESKIISAFKKASVGHRNGNGPKPNLPKKHVNRTFDSETNLLVKLSQDPKNIPLPTTMQSRYVIGKLIGDGNFAVVRQCRDKVSNEEYAMKIIDKSKCKGKEDMIDNEVRILSRVNHDYIMKLIAQQDTPNMLFLVVELVKGGDLFDAITVAQKYSEDQAALMMLHLTSALSYLHNMNIVHRDVKPENLLVDFEGDRVRTLKLGDFGLACEVTEPLFTVCGTPTYVAPEILAETGYGLKIDVWAAGVIMYILLCGYPPFVSLDNDQEKLFDCILSGQYEFLEEYWSDVSASAKELIQNMLQLAPDLRFSAEDVLDHPWLQRAGHQQNPGSQRIVDAQPEPQHENS